MWRIKLDRNDVVKGRFGSLLLKKRKTLT